MYSYSKSAHGELFGISPNELTLDQLEKVNFTKLLEFIELDPRVPHIVAYKLSNVCLNDIGHIKYLDFNVLKTYPNIVKAYNSYIKSRRLELDRSYSKDRYVFWKILNEENKKYEVENWIKNTRSIVTNSNVDYEYLWKNNYYSKIKTLIDTYMGKVFNEYNMWSSERSACIHMLKNVPKDLSHMVFPRIFESNNKRLSEFKLICLQNKNLPEEYVFSALKILGKRNKKVNIEVDIKPETLNKFPPIAKLNVIERIVHRADVIKVKNVEEFKSLMFNSMFKYPERVIQVTKIYKQKMGIENDK